MPDRIAIVGPGRLGRTLHTLLADTPHPPVLLGREPLPRGIDVVLLTVPDSAIHTVASGLPLGAIVLHCSGALDLDVLAPHVRVGSMHPLMTFPGPEVAVPDLQGVPMAIAGTQEARRAAEDIAGQLGMTTLSIPGDRRLYHAAAVLAGNFATVLLAEAGRALAAAGMSQEAARNALLPLALASLKNAVHRPAAALTGPVSRGDHQTLSGHREALKDAGLYDLVDLVDSLERHGRSVLLSAKEEE